MKSVVEFFTEKYGGYAKESYTLMEMLGFAEQYMKSVALLPLTAIVAKEFNITEDAMFSKSRKQACVNARQMYALLLSENMKVKTELIADHLGLDRVTILHSFKAARNLIDTERHISMIHVRLQMHIASGRVHLAEPLLPLFNHENNNHARETEINNKAMAPDDSGAGESQDNPQKQGQVVSYGKVEKREPSLQGEASAMCRVQ